MLIRWSITQGEGVAEEHHVVEEGKDKSRPREREEPIQVEEQTDQRVVGVQYQHEPEVVVVAAEQCGQRPKPESRP